MDTKSLTFWKGFRSQPRKQEASAMKQVYDRAGASGLGYTASKNVEKILSPVKMPVNPVRTIKGTLNP